VLLNLLLAGLKDLVLQILYLVAHLEDLDTHGHESIRLAESQLEVLHLLLETSSLADIARLGSLITTCMAVLVSLIATIHLARPHPTIDVVHVIISFVDVPLDRRVGERV